MMRNKVGRQVARNGLWNHLAWLTLSLLSCCLMLIACGGGGGGGGETPAPAPTTSATLTGTVSGTTVVAYDAAGNEAARAVASGVGLQKAFSLTVPIPGTYKIYLIENEQTGNPRVYPLYQGTTNVFSFGGGGTIDLGFVDTASGQAVAANSLLGAAGVSSGGEDAVFPAAIAAHEHRASDLEGSRFGLQLWSGVSPDGTMKAKGWSHAVSVTTGGVRHYTEYVRSNGNNTLPDDVTLSISPSGRFRSSDFTDETFVGYATSDRMWYVNVYTGESTSTPPYVYSGFVIAMKEDASKTYAVADLEGDWYWSNLDVSATATRERWYRGGLHTTAAGLTNTTSYLDSNGVNTDASSWTMNVADPANPVFTVNGSSSAYGIIGGDKSIYLRTRTTQYTVGQATEYRHGLAIAQKRVPGVTFSTADLAGTWHYFALEAGATQESNNWVYGKVSIASNGQFSYTSMRTTAGPQSDLPAGTFAVDSDGGIMQISAVTGGDVPEGFQGSISADKKIVVITMTATADDGITKKYTAGIMIR